MGLETLLKIQRPSSIHIISRNMYGQKTIFLGIDYTYNIPIWISSLFQVYIYIVSIRCERQSKILVCGGLVLRTAFLMLESRWVLKRPLVFTAKCRNIRVYNIFVSLKFSDTWVCLIVLKTLLQAVLSVYHDWLYSRRL